MAQLLFVMQKSDVSLALSKHHFPPIVTGAAARPCSAISIEICAEPLENHSHSFWLIS